MNRRDYDRKLNRLIYLAVSGPLVVVVGMYVMGAFLDVFLNTGSLFVYIFEGVGGVPLITLYYRKIWDELMREI